LPKDWATDNDVSAGSVVEFHSEEDVLLLSPQREEDREEGTLSIDVQPPGGGDYQDERSNTDVLVLAP